MKKTKIIIVSGFLGSGKTTFIKKLINDIDDTTKMAIIENEFGEVGIDGEVFKKYGMNVKEINSGCICCSVAGDFKSSILEMRKDYNPDLIIIEPSGVAKLSEIEGICNSNREEFYISCKIDIIDPFLYEAYSINFGDFYNDQIKNADVILFSRVSRFLNSGDRLDDIKNDILSKNKNANIILNEWNDIDSYKLLGIQNESKDMLRSSISLDVFNYGIHSNNNDFETVSLHVDKIFTKESLQEYLSSLFNEKNDREILRLKGFALPNFEFSCVPGEINIYEVDSVDETVFVLIGKNINS